LLSCVRDILGRHDFPAGKLVLELTETGRISDMTAALDQLHALSRMGIKLSIDDYGTGFASLDYFRVIPATEIKIDRRFISNLRPGASEMVLVASTIAMAHSMGCTVVAEGIEKQNEFDILAMSGCDLGQGYLIGKPMTPDLLVEAILPARLRRKA
jgi:diguanylate cyclase